MDELERIEMSDTEVNTTHVICDNLLSLLPLPVREVVNGLHWQINIINVDKWTTPAG